MSATGGATAVRMREGVAILDLPPQIDSTAEAALSSAYADAATRGAGPILLNFAGVDFLSSTGIALIVGVLARARKDGRVVSSYGLSDHYREIFEITRLADFMKIFPDEAAATAAAPGR